jgi:hypothetical protein
LLQAAPPGFSKEQEKEGNQIQLEQVSIESHDCFTLPRSGLVQTSLYTAAPHLMIPSKPNLTRFPKDLPRQN